MFWPGRPWSPSVTEPRGGGQAGGVADHPGGAVVVGRTRLGADGELVRVETSGWISEPEPRFSTSCSA